MIVNLLMLTKPHLLCYFEGIKVSNEIDLKFAFKCQMFTTISSPTYDFNTWGV